MDVVEAKCLVCYLSVVSTPCNKTMGGSWMKILMLSNQYDTVTELDTTVLWIHLKRKIMSFFWEYSEYFLLLCHWYAHIFFVSSISFGTHVPLVPNELNSLSLPSELSFPLRISFTSLSNSTSFLFREDHLEFEKDAERKYNDKQKSVNIWLTTTERSVSQLPHTAKNIKAVEAQLQQVLVSQTLLNNWQLCNK